MFLTKNSQIEKKRNSFAAASPEKTSPQTLSIRLPPEFQQLFNPHLLITSLKSEEAQRTKHKIVRRVFCAYWYMY